MTDRIRKAIYNGKVSECMVDALASLSTEHTEHKADRLLLDTLGMHDED